MATAAPAGPTPEQVEAQQKAINDRLSKFVSKDLSKNTSNQWIVLVVIVVIVIIAASGTWYYMRGTKGPDGSAKRKVPTGGSKSVFPQARNETVVINE